MARQFSVPLAAGEWLQQFATIVSRDLAKEPLGAFQSLPSRRAKRAPYTDGWYADIGNVTVKGTDGIGAFVDTFSRADVPRLWIGFFVAGHGRASSMAKHLRRHIGTVVEYEHERFESKNGHWYLSAPLKAKHVDVPIAELFRDGVKDIGVYLPERIDWARAPSTALVKKAVRFLAEAIVGLESYTAAPPKLFTNSEVVVTSRVFKRSQPQAKAAFARDRWTCRLCEERPSERYGIEGRRCLEAHHVHALHAQKGKRVTRMSDLVTVCANCHRVLAAFAPTRRGFKELRRHFALRLP